MDFNNILDCLIVQLQEEITNPNIEHYLEKAQSLMKYFLGLNQ